MTIYDHIVVGSGCSGAIAAQTLIENGANVLMVDVGTHDDKLQKLIPDKNYLDIRKTDENQSQYLIGPKGEGIAWGQISKGAQITPTHHYMTRSVNTYIPYTSDGFSPLESLAYGGLGIGWGLQCWEYSEADLKASGLPVSATRKAYEVVSRRIGISATNDEAAKYTLGTLEHYQDSTQADRNHRYIQSLYRKRLSYFQDKGLHVGRTPLALLTEDQGERQAYKYRDMDFYTDNSSSAWRPWMTVNQLKKNPHFTYRGNLLVLSFKEKDDIVTIECLETTTNKRTKLSCRKLILASSALGTARIALRSLGDGSGKTSLLSNPHSYIPCVQPAMLGSGSEDKKLGFGQLSYFLDQQGNDSGGSVATSYSYQSLMLFRTITQIPLNYVDARTFSRYLLPGLIVLLVQHPDRMSDDKYLHLVDDEDSPTGDKLSINYKVSNDDDSTWNKREKQYMSLLRGMHTYALKRVAVEHGSSVHYAGTLPFSEKSKDLHLAPTGRLHGTRHVYAADSSGFQFLPAKGLTFTLMANAHITAENVLHGRN